MVERKDWKEFRETGLLWWINRTLHLFGWAIVFDFDKETGELNEVYPAKCSFRGFDYDSEDRGFQNVTQYLEDNISKLKEDLDK